MPRRHSSLAAGRNRVPLTPEQVTRVTNTFLGLDSRVVTRHDASRNTVFRVERDPATNEQYGEIVFGADIYPGTDVIDPNAGLSLMAAAAHELTHYYRWENMQALNDPELEHLDEAFTSLQAISYFATLRPADVRQLAADAMQRLDFYRRELEQATSAATNPLDQLRSDTAR